MRRFGGEKGREEAGAVTRADHRPMTVEPPIYTGCSCSTTVIFEVLQKIADQAETERHSAMPGHRIPEMATGDASPSGEKKIKK